MCSCCFLVSKLNIIMSQIVIFIKYKKVCNSVAVKIEVPASSWKLTTKFDHFIWTKSPCSLSEWALFAHQRRGGKKSHLIQRFSLFIALQMVKCFGFFLTEKITAHHVPKLSFTVLLVKAEEWNQCCRSVIPVVVVVDEQDIEYLNMYNYVTDLNTKYWQHYT